MQVCSVPEVMRFPHCILQGKLESVKSLQYGVSGYTLRSALILFEQ
jgi:hypothetical protein